MWAARQRPVPASAVRWLAGIFLLGALGRVISLVLMGPPQWFQVVLTVIEIVLPPLFFWLAPADERSAATAGVKAPVGRWSMRRASRVRR